MARELAWTALAGAAAVSVLLLAPRATGGTPPPRLLLVGDSLAVGLTGPLASIARARRGAFSAVAAQNTTAAHWQARIDDARVAFEPDAVVFSLGANDCAAGARQACAAFEAHVRTLNARASRDGARVIWLCPAWLEYAPTIRAKLHTVGVEVFEPPPGLRLSADHIHPTPAGYQAWAEAIQREVYP